ncbi:hypothetical protein [Fusibacter sp. JL216-2]|uniref:hypothetical protein n=1 Tax=Fusibacter sp. JL216-2 TaxID=3071453 RepID=UPI003D32D113
MKVPGALEDFNHYKHEDIDIYIDKNVRTKNGLIYFKLDKLLMFKKIIAQGLDIDMERT